MKMLCQTHMTPLQAGCKPPQKKSLWANAVNSASGALLACIG